MNASIRHLNPAKLKRFISAHKFISGAVAAVIIAGGYYGYRTITSTSGETRYVLAVAERGTLIVSVSGSGQVSASNQIDLKPKASGEIIAVAVQNGQSVRAGELVVQLDARDAAKRDGEHRHQQDRLQDGPGRSEERLLVSDLQVAPHEEVEKLAVLPEFTKAKAHPSMVCADDDRARLG